MELRKQFISLFGIAWFASRNQIFPGMEIEWLIYRGNFVPAAPWDYVIQSEFGTRKRLLAVHAAEIISLENIGSRQFPFSLGNLKVVC